MYLSDFDYDLPEELIAQNPLPERDSSRMLVVDRPKGSWFDATFKAFPDYLRSDDVVVVNNSRVIPARLSGHRLPSGGKVEIFLVRQIEPLIWEALVRPGVRLRAGSQVTLGGGRLLAELLDDPGHEIRKVSFQCDEPFENLISEIGSTPLPPYIKRPLGVSRLDQQRYQTIYAKERGAIAAPTAGLHFTNDVLAQVSRRAHLTEVTLHVGYGTFEPVRVDDVSQHSVSGESFAIDEDAGQTINAAKARGARVVAVGTTTLRALESAATEASRVKTGGGIASLTITPGYNFKIADALLTNFHLPKSSLLLLVSAFAGHELILDAYRHAVAHRYRFYSYGDCMLIL